jgi:hypothetical protein
MDEHDSDRLALLDRLDERVPELDLDQNEIEWRTLDDGAEALIVYFANAGEDVHAVGSLDPLIPGAIGCIVIRPDGGRYLARAVPDPLRPD